MDPRIEHFYVMVGELCEQANLAELTVQVTTADGQLLRGVPLVRSTPDHGAGSLSRSGYANHVMVGAVSIRLEDVLEVLLVRPAEAHA